MPRKKRKKVFSRISDVMMNQLHYHFVFTGQREYLDEELKAAWFANKNRIMDEWFLDPKNTGCRPWAWWKFQIGVNDPKEVLRKINKGLVGRVIVDIFEMEYDYLDTLGETR
jgi:hypothetical protein